MTNDEIEDAFWNANGKTCMVREDTLPAPQRMYDTCKKEARETKHFLRMVVCAVPELKPKARPFCGKLRNSISYSPRPGEVPNESHSSVILFTRHSSLL
jgi:hypothetical protein